MLDWMFVCVLILAVLFMLMIIMFEDDIQPQWLFGLVILDIVIWWALASGQFEIEQPYQMYNATSGQIEKGYHYISSKTSPALFYIFLAPAVLMSIYMNYMVFIVVLNALKKMGIIRSK